MDSIIDIKKVEKVSKALGDPYRIKIIEAIKAETDWTLCSAIVNMLDISQSNVSHHLHQLIDAGLLIEKKEGRNVKYKINTVVFAGYINFLNSYKDI